MESTTALPFRAGAFDLVVSRHPVSTDWHDVARVLTRGGRVISQQIGPRTLGELSDALLGPRPPRSNREPDATRGAAARAGLVVDRLDAERTPVTFHDIGAVVYFLRLVPWIVPDFDVDRFATELRALHDRIERDGSFETSSSRFLVVAHHP